MDKVKLAEIETARGSMASAVGERSVHVAGRTHDAVPTYRRETLRAGHTIAGPAIIDQLDTTTLIPPAFTGEIDRFGNIVMRREGRG